MIKALFKKHILFSGEILVNNGVCNTVYSFDIKQYDQTDPERIILTDYFDQTFEMIEGTITISNPSI